MNHDFVSKEALTDWWNTCKSHFSLDESDFAIISLWSPSSNRWLDDTDGRIHFICSDKDTTVSIIAAQNCLQDKIAAYRNDISEVSPTKIGNETRGILFRDLIYRYCADPQPIQIKKSRPENTNESNEGSIYFDPSITFEDERFKFAVEKIRDQLRLTLRGKIISTQQEVFDQSILSLSACVIQLCYLLPDNWNTTFYVPCNLKISNNHSISFGGIAFFLKNPKVESDKLRVFCEYLLGTPSAIEYASLARYHGLRSQSSAIISRNMSHHLGSHVLFPYKDAKAFADLAALVQKTELCATPGYDGTSCEFSECAVHKTHESRSPRDKLFPAFSVKGCEAKAFTDAAEKNILARALVDEMVARLLQYSRERMDFIAEVTTGIAGWEMPMSIHDIVTWLVPSPAVDDPASVEMPDKIKGDTPEAVSYLRGQHLLFYNLIQLDRTNWILSLKFNVGREKMAKKTFVAVPGGVHGLHAFAAIFENIVRNTAKHSPGKDKVEEQELKFTIDWEEHNCSGEDGRPAIHFMVRDNVEREIKDLQRILCDDCRAPVNVNKDCKKSECLNARFMDPIIANDGKSSNKFFGLKELKICQGYLLSKSMEDSLWETAAGACCRFSHNKENGNLEFRFSMFKPATILFERTPTINLPESEPVCENASKIPCIGVLDDEMDSNDIYPHYFYAKSNNVDSEAIHNNPVRLPARLISLSDICSSGPVEQLIAGYEAYLPEFLDRRLNWPDEKKILHVFCSGIGDKSFTAYDRNVADIRIICHKLKTGVKDDKLVSEIDGLFSGNSRLPREGLAISLLRHAVNQRDGVKTVVFQNLSRAMPQTALIEELFGNQKEGKEHDDFASRYLLYAIVEGYLTRIAVFDERLGTEYGEPCTGKKDEGGLCDTCQDEASRGLCKREKYPHIIAENREHVIPWKVFPSLSVFSPPKLENDHLLTRWSPDQFKNCMKPGLDYVVIHQGLIDKAKTDLQDEQVVAKVLDGTYSSQVVVISGRGKPQDVPEHCRFASLSSFSQHFRHRNPVFTSMVLNGARNRPRSG